MPPHLHPRSRMTSSLFATTVVASFFVVALPHILPCPVPSTKFADGEVVVDENGRRRVWRRRDSSAPPPPPRVEDGIVHFSQAAAADNEDDGGMGTKTQTQTLTRARRECPVPKPGGLLGELLGFHGAEDDAGKKRTR